MSKKYMTNLGFAKKLELTALALASESIYVVVAFVPLAPIVALTAIFYSTKFAIASGLLLFIGFWWLIQPDTRLHDTFSDLEKTSSLFRIVAQLCEEMDAPKPHRIALTNDLNAAAHQSSGIFSILGVRRTLLLGVPLLKVLQEDEVKAVIAHELGHLSRQHGRLGHWIYRVRAKWETESYNASDGGTVDNLLRALSDWISPAFIKRSAEWSLHCEYEADQSAANAGFAKPLARALVKLDALFDLLHYKFRRSLSEANLRGDAPPTDYWATLLATARQHADASFIAQTIASGKTRKSGAHQISHPPTADRIAHLGVHLPDIEWNTDSCAGDVLVGADWSSVYEKCATQERESLTEYWSIHHYHLLANEMIANNSLLPAQDDDVDGRELRQLTARDVIEETDATLQSLREHADANPKSAHALYEYGAALLRRERAYGVDFIRSAYRVDRAYAPQGTSLIHNFLHRFGTHQEAMSAWRTYQNAIEWVERFADDLWARLLSSPLRAAPNTVAKLLISALKDRAELDACWLVSLDSRQVVNRALRINVLVLRVNPQAYSASGKNEDALVSNVVSLARGLFTPDELIRTMVFYTTEPIDPKLYTRLTAVQGATIIAPTKPVNENLIKIDSL